MYITSYFMYVWYLTEFEYSVEHNVCLQER
jgi:hypothetical protein